MKSGNPTKPKEKKKTTKCVALTKTTAGAKSMKCSQAMLRKTALSRALDPQSATRKDLFWTVAC